MARLQPLLPVQNHVQKEGSTPHAGRSPAATMYVVGLGQALHFLQVFAVLNKLGLPRAEGLEHVGFGVMLVGGKRCRNLLHKAGVRKGELTATPHPTLSGEAEWSLLTAIGAFPQAVRHAAERCGPPDWRW